jgi:hypothetical protein
VFGEPLEHNISGSLLVSRHRKKRVEYHEQVVLALHGTLDRWLERVSLRKRHHLPNNTVEGWISTGGLGNNRSTYRNCAVSDPVEVEGLD